MNEFRSETIAAVAFDAVGTLIDPEPPVAVAYAEAARRQGIVLEVAEVRRRFRHAFGTVESDDMRGPLATDEAGEVRRWQRIVAEVLPELPDPRRGFDELWDHFAHPKHWRAFDDAGATLRGLAELGIPVTIASNFDARLRPILQGLEDLAPWATGLVVSSEIGWRKPHPAFYQTVATRLGMEPSRILCVGDDPANDEEGPCAAGFPTLRIDRDGVAGSGTIRSLTEVLRRIVANSPTETDETLG